MLARFLSEKRSISEMSMKKKKVRSEIFIFTAFSEVCLWLWPVRLRQWGGGWVQAVSRSTPGLPACLCPSHARALLLHTLTRGL